MLDISLKQRANVNAITNTGLTPLRVAVLEDAFATAEVLRRSGARR